MTARQDVSRVLAGRLVQALAADGETMALLFSRRPQVHPYDSRIYTAWAELPAEIAEVIPRIIVSVTEMPFDTEQPSADGSSPYGECSIYVHVIVEHNQEDLGRLIAAQARAVLVSTPLSDASIIVSGLWTVSHRTDRETAFRDAFRMTREFRAQAGVLS